jgi:hypothetical protein
MICNAFSIPPSSLMLRHVDVRTEKMPAFTVAGSNLHNVAPELFTLRFRPTVIPLKYRD